MEGSETSLFWFHIHCCDFKELLRKSSIAEARADLGHNAKLQPIISGKSRQALKQLVTDITVEQETANTSLLASSSHGGLPLFSSTEIAA